jgi:hypothetical protein
MLLTRIKGAGGASDPVDLVAVVADGARLASATTAPPAALELARGLLLVLLPLLADRGDLCRALEASSVWERGGSGECGLPLARLGLATGLPASEYSSESCGSSPLPLALPDRADLAAGECGDLASSTSDALSNPSSPS